MFGVQGWLVPWSASMMVRIATQKARLMTTIKRKSRSYKSAQMFYARYTWPQPTPPPHIDYILQVLKFCSHHTNNPMAKIKKPLYNCDMAKNVSKWDYKFISCFSQKMLFKLIDVCLNSSEYSVCTLCEHKKNNPHLFIRPQAIWMSSR